MTAPDPAVGAVHPERQRWVCFEADELCSPDEPHEGCRYIARFPVQHRTSGLSDAAHLAAIVGDLWDFPPEDDPTPAGYRLHLAERYGSDVAEVWDRLADQTGQGGDGDRWTVAPPAVPSPPVAAPSAPSVPERPDTQDARMALVCLAAELPTGSSDWYMPALASVVALFDWIDAAGAVEGTAPKLDVIRCTRPGCFRSSLTGHGYCTVECERADRETALPEPAEVERLKLAITLAQELGSAYRGDWSGFDGRTLRSQLDDLSSVGAGSWDAERFRASNSLCPHGDGHWTEYCDDTCARRTTGEDTADV